jgi:carbon-monoxide dehydrogenase large subunit
MTAEDGGRRERFIGRPLPRLEDVRLVTGQGHYTDDISLPGQAYAAFVRSPHPHARIMRIDTNAARHLVGVIAVMTAENFSACGVPGVRHRPNPADALDIKKPAFATNGPRPVLDAAQLPFAAKRVTYSGEPVAVVVAETPEAARDGCERVVVIYEVLPAVVDAHAALAPGAPLVLDMTEDNVALETEFGDRAGTHAALARAHLVVEHRFHAQRIVNAQIEPRAAIGSYDPKAGIYTLISGTQGVHRIQSELAAGMGIAPERLRVITQDVGGAFGLRSNVYPEQLVVAWAAREIGRPVKWLGDRSETFLTDYQGRDIVATARLALDDNGRILALATDIVANVGATTVSYVPPSNYWRVMTTAYDIPATLLSIRGVLTNTVPTAPFRGAGRPEATFVLERLLDIAARRLDVDRIALRRRNLIARGKMPYRTQSGLLYDSGNFRGNMERALALGDWAGFATRRKAAKARGRLAGIAVANYVETPVGIPHERVAVTVRTDGVVEAVAGTQSSGQGHETTFSQVLADRLGVRPEEVKLVTGDSAVIASGGGTHSDRSMRLAGTLLVQSSDQIIAQGRRVFSALTGAAETDVTFEDGFFRAPQTNRRLDVFDMARAIAREPALSPDLRQPLAASAVFTGRIHAYPTGSVVCEVEVDPDTGAVAMRRYASVDDCGQPINPLVLHGQVHGGMMQGAGQALVEGVMYDEKGQVLTGSFMDYGMPRADMTPDFTVELAEDPTGGNPLRVKGGGEAGITPALAVIINAIVDALSVYGVEHIEMPATPSRVWAAIQEARKTA